MAIKICLDAGHAGKYNRSPVVRSYYESDMNWKLHLKLKEALEAYGIEVITTRADKDKDLELYARGMAAKGCDLFLSIHSNAADRESADYPLAIVPIDGSGDALGKKLTECIRNCMDTKEPGDMWSRKSDSGYDWYGVIRGAAWVGVTGIILEHSFYTNTRAANWLLSDSNLDKLAKAEAEVIATHYGLTQAEPTPGVKLPMLRKGIRGETVKAMQILLIGYGYSCGHYGADGDFGNGTHIALVNYQGDHNLATDGICGPQTWASLLGVK